MDEQTRLDAARAVGMKSREVVDVATLDDGLIVTTHDGQQLRVSEDGAVTPHRGDVVEAAPIEPAEEAEVEAPAPAKPKPRVKRS